jgi:hypothetical protein
MKQRVKTRMDIDSADHSESSDPERERVDTSQGRPKLGRPERLRVGGQVFRGVGASAARSTTLHIVLKWWVTSRTCKANTESSDTPRCPSPNYTRSTS